MIQDLRRTTATMMFADVVEFVRLAQEDELGTIERVHALLGHLSTQIIPMERGTALETRGDGILVEFPTPASAVACAFAIHRFAVRESSGYDAEASMRVRIGIHTAEVWSDRQTVYGTGVNLAARVAALAGPGETVISGSTRDGLVAGIDADIQDIGDCYLKHVREPIRAYRLRPLGTFSVTDQDGGQSSQPSKPCLAVIPFRAMGDQLDASSVGELLAQSVIHAASRNSAINVIAWLSSRTFAERNMSAIAIGASLKADWLITGTYFLSGDRLLVQADLVRAATGITERSERIVDTIADLLQAESEIAGRLVDAIARTIADIESRRVAKHPLPTLESHSLLVGAIGLMHRSGPHEFMRSKDALEHLMERHPRMHALRPWLAKWYVMCATRGLSKTPADEAGKALEQTSRALDARPDDAFALAVRGFVYFHLKHDLVTASELLNSAVSIDPNDALASIFSAAVLSAKGMKNEAWAKAERAMRLSPFDPLRPYVRFIAAGCALSAENFVQAVKLARDSIHESSAHAASWRTLVIALVGAGEIEAARAACGQLMAIEPTLTLSAYRARSSLPPEQANRAIEALSIAGVPLH